ncbi:uncharacterized protein LOC134209631 [Armigeres subalbatus]|uniref:uncharacterized protein LOC134209631 n=1 Tax=Armigeres subalbatus TaxID=124917 RepID=UPI002ED4329C
MSHRTNTLVVDFGVLPKRPPLEQVKQFLEKSIKLDMADVKSLQLHNLNNCVFIEMNEAGVAPRLQQQHHLKHSFHRLGVIYHIPVYVDGPTTTIKLHDLSPHMPNTTIINHLKQYGDIISIQNETWKNFFPGVLNGVRVVRMMVEKPIPSRISIENEPTLVTGQKQNDQPQSKCPVATSEPTSEIPSNTSEQITTGPPPVQTESNESENDDDDDERQIEPGTTGASAKRRLSAASGTASDTRADNIPKRSCGEDAYNTGDTREHDEADWRVYNTRSRKKNVSNL